MIKSLNSEIEQKLRSEGASLVGFADVSTLPASMTGGLPRAVSVAVRLASTIARGQPARTPGRSQR